MPKTANGVTISLLVQLFSWGLLKSFSVSGPTQGAPLGVQLDQGTLGAGGRHPDRSEGLFLSARTQQSHTFPQASLFLGALA